MRGNSERAVCFQETKGKGVDFWGSNKINPFENALFYNGLHMH